MARELPDPTVAIGPRDLTAAISLRALARDGLDLTAVISPILWKLDPTAVRSPIAWMLDQTAVRSPIAWMLDPTAGRSPIAWMLDPTAVRSAIAWMLDPTAVRSTIAWMLDPTAVRSPIAWMLDPTAVRSPIPWMLDPTAVRSPIVWMLDPTAVRSPIAWMLDPTAVRSPILVIYSRFNSLGKFGVSTRTTYRTSTQMTPYSLVYGVEAVLPLEQQIPSLRIAIQEGLCQEDDAKLRLQELEALDEKRLEAQQRIECYQARMTKSFNKKVRPRSFQVGDLVLAV